jgi:hypothetical protein
MSPSSRTTFQIEVPGSVVQMFKQPEYVSQYFVGEEGRQYWEDFIGSSRMARLEHKIDTLEQDVPAAKPQGRKAITFVELDEEQVRAREEKARVVVQEEPKAPEVLAEPVQMPVVQTVIRTEPSPDETAQQLAKILGNFSFDAIRSEIDHRFAQLYKDLETKVPATDNQAAASEAPAEPATTATFQIETAKIPAPNQDEPKAAQTDYSSLMMSDDAKDKDSDEGTGIDIMALLAAQAKKMESVSTIDMMQMYDEDFTEVTLEELEKYINKIHKQKRN